MPCEDSIGSYQPLELSCCCHGLDPSLHILYIEYPCLWALILHIHYRRFLLWHIHIDYRRQILGHINIDDRSRLLRNVYVYNRRSIIHRISLPMTIPIAKPATNPYIKLTISSLIRNS
jgi:hypothetical protein